MGKIHLGEQIRSTELPEGAVAIWALGQEGFLIKSQHATVAIDLYLTDSIFQEYGQPWVRKFPPPLAPEELPPLDIVMCTHHHQDHMDRQTLAPLLGRKGTTFVVPASHAHLLKEWGGSSDRIVGMNHGEERTIAGVTIRAFAGMHDRFEVNEEGQHFYLGYTITTGGVTCYHAGDTIGFSELPVWLGHTSVDIAMVPINGRDFARTEAGIVGNMNYREAADLAMRMEADVTIPMHYGLFAHNDENPAYFVDYVYHTYPGMKYHLMVPGERYVYYKNK